MQFILYVIVSFAIVFLPGCASFEQVSYQSIKNKLPLIDLANGVNDQEAIVLAQNFIISKGLGDRLYTLKPIGVERKNVWISDEGSVEFYVPPGDDFKGKLEEYWFVLFRDKKGSQLFGCYPVIPFYVKVDAKNGEVMKWGLKTDEVR